MAETNTITRIDVQHDALADSQVQQQMLLVQCKKLLGQLKMKKLPRLGDGD